MVLPVRSLPRRLIVGSSRLLRYPAATVAAVFALTSSSPSSSPTTRRFLPCTVAAAMSTSASTSNTDVASSSSSHPPRRPPMIAAVAQLRSTNDKFHNLMDVATCAGMARAQGASMLFLPECFAFLGTSSDETLQQAEDPQYLELHGKANDKKVIYKNSENVRSALQGAIRKVQREDEKDELAAAKKPPTRTELDNNNDVESITEALAFIALETGLWISAGGMHVAGAPPDPQTGNQRVYNAHIILDREGVVQVQYNKRHMFDVHIPGQVELRESKTTAAGTQAAVVCDSPLGRLGLSTCYDVRFPEHYQALVQKQGAQILLVPSAFTVPTGMAHWHTLLQARAIENQCYVLAAAQFGVHNDKRKSFGHALAVDPWGRVVADAGGYKDHEDDKNIVVPSIVTCEIDQDLLESTRQRMPLQLHRQNATNATRE